MNLVATVVSCVISQKPQSFCEGTFLPLLFVVMVYGL